jgi:hypothetical protein
LKGLALLAMKLGAPITTDAHAKTKRKRRENMSDRIASVPQMKRGFLDEDIETIYSTRNKFAGHFIKACRNRYKRATYANPRVRIE